MLIVKNTNVTLTSERKHAIKARLWQTITHCVGT